MLMWLHFICFDNSVLQYVIMYVVGRVLVPVTSTVAVIKQRDNEFMILGCCRY